MKRKGGNKKGLSLEEKIEKVERWFQTHPAPYLMKEVQILIPKATGVIYQSIPEVMETLVSEYRICEEKIGIQTFYWCFPLTATQKANAVNNFAAGARASGKAPGPPSLESLAAMNRSELQAALDDRTAYAEQLQQRLSEAQEKLGFPSLEAQQAVQALSTELFQRRDALQRQQQQRRATAQRQRLGAGFGGGTCSSLAINRGLCRTIQNRIKMALSASNRWTENFLLLQDDILHRRPGFSAKELGTMVGCREEMDFLSEQDVQEWLQLPETEKEPLSPTNPSADKPLCSAHTSTAESRASVGHKASSSSTAEEEEHFKGSATHSLPMPIPSVSVFPSQEERQVVAAECIGSAPRPPLSTNAAPPAESTELVIQPAGTGQSRKRRRKDDESHIGTPATGSCASSPDAKGGAVAREETPAAESGTPEAASRTRSGNDEDSVVPNATGGGNSKTRPKRTKKATSSARQEKLPGTLAAHTENLVSPPSPTNEEVPIENQKRLRDEAAFVAPVSALNVADETGAAESIKGISPCDAPTKAQKATRSTANRVRESKKKRKAS